MASQFSLDRAKIKAVILHTCRACPPERLGAVKLHKVLYFLDMINFAQTGMSVTGATYNKRPFGPTCLQLLPVVREMVAGGALDVREVDYYGLRKKEYIGLVPPASNALGNGEMALLDEVIDFVCNQHSAKSISDYSHQLPWEMAAFGEEIPYKSAFMLFPAPTSLEAFEVIDEESGVEAWRATGENIVEFPSLRDFRARLLNEGLPG
nr:Panacea domain-containing protein [Polymorphobacter sp.]